MRIPLAIVVTLAACAGASAKPAHLKALADYIGPAFPKAVNDCKACHLPGEDEADKTHNDFGKRLADWRKDRRKAGLPNDIPLALDAVGDDDSDKDGVGNLIELLAGHFPGDIKDVPTLAERAEGAKKLAVVRSRRSEYAWEPFQVVRRPALPKVKNPEWARNPIDAFVAEQHDKVGLTPRPEAAKATLLRRVYIDLIGLPPTRDELHSFLSDPAPDAYEKVVDRLLRSPQYGEAQARHWMDVWRYSDWAGFGAEIRDSQYHMWRWRDWIVESMNADRPYAQQIREMLAGDEIAPTDPNTIRATGYLARSWYKFSRDVWLDRVIEHTSKAFLGVTINCAKCHDHMYDPIPQTEYYAFRAIFAPHDLRVDRVPGQPDLVKDGVSRVYDANLDVPTYLYVRGNEKDPDKSKAIPPAVPVALRGPKFEIKAVPLPRLAVSPDRRPFVIEETRKANEAVVVATRQAVRLPLARLAGAALGSSPWSLIGQTQVLDLRKSQYDVAVADVAVAEQKGHQITCVAAAEALDLKTDAGQAAATRAGMAQRELAVAEAKKAVASARVGLWMPAPKDQPAPAKKLADAEAALAKAETALKAPPTAAYAPLPVKSYPATSTGRRLALANWIADKQNPLTARVAMNHLWLRRFGVGLVPTVFDFGKNGQPPTHPKLLDWLAAEFMDRDWSLRDMHRLIVTSSTYRMDSTYESANAARDADNRFLWRMPIRRMTGEAIRDSLLACAGDLDRTTGGPELDHNLGMTVKRRSIYFRHAPEKQMQFLELFDAPSPTECYKRSESVVPQQALALANSPLTQTESRLLAGKLTAQFATDTAFITAAFETILSRPPTEAERDECGRFLRDQPAALARPRNPTATGTPLAVPPAKDLKQRARESLVHVLMNHNDFVTVR